MNRKSYNNIYTNSRQSNIELLRIVAMLMIIAHHFSVHGNFDLRNMLVGNNIWLQFLATGGKIGVNIFVMISGYFLISSKNIETKKVLKLLAQILFYSVIIFILFISLKIVSFNRIDFINYILGFPVWWFAKSYLALYLIHPYINKCVDNLNKKEYQKLVLFFTILWSFIPTILNKSFDDGNLIWFVYIYLIGGYLKKFPINIKCKSKKYWLIFLLLYFSTFLSVVVLDWVGCKFPSVAQYSLYFFKMEKFPTLLISLTMFLSFLNLNLKYNKIINIISSSMFGIYLIHDSSYTRMFLWKLLFRNASYSNTYMLIPYSLIVIIIVFIACSLIELIRIYLFEKQYMILIEKISKFIDRYIDKFLNLNIFDRI